MVWGWGVVCITLNDRLQSNIYDLTFQWKLLASVVILIILPLLFPVHVCSVPPAVGLPLSEGGNRTLTSGTVSVRARVHESETGTKASCRRVRA